MLCAVQHRKTKRSSDQRVLRFRPRGTVFTRPLPSPVEDLSRYQGGAEPDDYRHRMRMNAAGLAATIVLVLVGVWIASTMAELRKGQDCALAGRRDCALAHTPLQPRW